GALAAAARAALGGPRARMCLVDRHRGAALDRRHSLEPPDALGSSARGLPRPLEDVAPRAAARSTAVSPVLRRRVARGRRRRPRGPVPDRRAGDGAGDLDGLPALLGSEGGPLRGGPGDRRDAPEVAVLRARGPRLSARGSGRHGLERPVDGRALVAALSDRDRALGTRGGAPAPRAPSKSHRRHLGPRGPGIFAPPAPAPP